jgi:hypothetical protein
LSQQDYYEEASQTSRSHDSIFNKVQRISRSPKQINKAGKRVDMKLDQSHASQASQIS